MKKIASFVLLMVVPILFNDCGDSQITEDSFEKLFQEKVVFEQKNETYLFSKEKNEYKIDLLTETDLEWILGWENSKTPMDELNAKMKNYKDSKSFSNCVAPPGFYLVCIGSFGVKLIRCVKKLVDNGNEVLVFGSGSGVYCAAMRDE
jgi:ribosomal protein L11 methylase PrmA